MMEVSAKVTMAIIVPYTNVSSQYVVYLKLIYTHTHTHNIKLYVNYTTI